MSVLIQRKQQPQVCVDETKAYWLRVVPLIWPTTYSKKKVLNLFRHQLKSGIAFNSQASLQARIEALSQLLSQAKVKPATN